MKSCLDCLYCKIKFPINTGDPLLTSLVLFPGRGIYRRMGCGSGQWVVGKGRQASQSSMPYNKHNIELAREGNHRYLNQNRECHYFFDMED